MPLRFVNPRKEILTPSLSKERSTIGKYPEVTRPEMKTSYLEERIKNIVLKLEKKLKTRTFHPW